MTPSQILLPKVSPVIHKGHVLIHFVLGHLRHGGQRLLEVFLADLSKRGPFACLGLHLAEAVQDVGAGIVIRGRQHALPQRFFPVRQDSLDELPGVVGGIEQRDRGAFRSGEIEGVFVRGRIRCDHAPGDVGHVEARHEEGGRDGKRADVFLHLGFGIKVVYAGKGSIGD